MITHVHFKNYRSLDDVRVDLGRLTVLVGRNGAGKSNFVDAIQFVQDALLLGIDVAVGNRGGLSALRHWTAAEELEDVEIEVGIQAEGLSGVYQFALAIGEDGETHVAHEIYRLTEDGEDEEAYEIRKGAWVTKPARLTSHEDLASVIQPSGRSIAEIDSHFLFLPSSRILSGYGFRTMYSLLTNNQFYAIYPNTLREPQRISSARAMGKHGENFASVLRRIIARWEKQHDGAYPDLIAALTRIVDDIVEVRVNHAGPLLVTELRHTFQRARGVEDITEFSPWFDAFQESDGTLRALGLLIALYQSDPKAGLMAIEEPETNIHAGVLAVLAEVLHEASQRRQVLITTHSPDFISQFSADELRVVERVSGDTRIGLIGESQRKTIEKQLFTTGDLLRIEGLHSLEEEAEAVHA